jgi:hypothetical protein
MKAVPLASAALGCVVHRFPDIVGKMRAVCPLCNTRRQPSRARQPADRLGHPKCRRLVGIGLSLLSVRRPGSVKGHSQGAGALSAGLNLHCSWPILAALSVPVGFVIPAQPVLASKPPFSADWVHEIKHDGYRIIVRRDDLTVRFYSRNAYGATGGDHGCCRADQGQELHDRRRGGRGRA